VTGRARKSASYRKSLIPYIHNKEFRDGYLSRQLKVFLSAQIRALRGGMTQGEFGKRIGKPQSVVSRLEKQSYGHINLQTLIEIATKLDIGLVIRFVNFPTFLKWTNDTSAAALAPEPYARSQIDELVREEEAASEPKRLIIKPPKPDEPIQVFDVGFDKRPIEVPLPEGDATANQPRPDVTHNRSGGKVLQ
jgi:transcriptional regulator with XRE-family HTH domain